ncbi:hypothetical protein KTR10_01540 [Candidatus Kaiserbacteria bacterium]|nr:hypothetical protein [Candidatus Kaiserbacteria bacterium]
MPLVRWIAHFFGYGDDPLAGPTVDDFILSLSNFWEVYSVIALLLSLLFFAGFVYAYIRYNQLLVEEDNLLLAEEQRWRELREGAGTQNTEWDAIKAHVATENPNDWKQAIIAADVMLGEILEVSGYIGETIGEQLKSANAQPFPSIRDAWDAHLVRNKIAHGGPEFVLTKRLAQDTIVQYERVFREFGAV